MGHGAFSSTPPRMMLAVYTLIAVGLFVGCALAGEKDMLYVLGIVVAALMAASALAEVLT